jgi:hypothetical protein
MSRSSTALIGGRWFCTPVDVIGPTPAIGPFVEKVAADISF